jgi:hypothetical protein
MPNPNTCGSYCNLRGNEIEIQQELMIYALHKDTGSDITCGRIYGGPDIASELKDSCLFVGQDCVFANPVTLLVNTTRVIYVTDCSNGRDYSLTNLPIPGPFAADTNVTFNGYVTELAGQLVIPPGHEIYSQNIRGITYETIGGGGGGGGSGNGSSSQTGAPPGFTYSLTYNATQAKWTYGWNDLHGTMSATELKVFYYSNNTYSQWDTNSSSVNPGNLSLDVRAIENNTMRGFAYLTDYNRTFVGGATTIQIANLWVYSTPIIDSGVFTIDEPEGVFWAMMIVGTMAVMSFFNPPVAIMTAIGGLFITSALGLFEISTGILMLLGLMGGILIWRLRK